MKPLFAVLPAVAVVSLMGAPAQAQTFRELMEDIGLQKREQHKMDFNERAPLVLPPDTNNLPPPEQTGALASVNPSWPTDPDDAAEREAAEREKLPERERRKYQEDAAKGIYKIRGQERRALPEAGKTEDYETALKRNNPVLTPEELKEAQKKGLTTGDQATVVMSEPERRRLTDPPPGYRMPSASQPYGPGEEKRKSGSNSGWLSKINPFD